jgi:hypothetical protein
LGLGVSEQFVHYVPDRQGSLDQAVALGAVGDFGNRPSEVGAAQATKTSPHENPETLIVDKRKIEISLVEITSGFECAHRRW